MQFRILFSSKNQLISCTISNNNKKYIKFTDFNFHNYFVLFQCREEAHRPLSCSKFKEWMNLIGGKNSDEIDSLWIKLNTKKCPKCKIDIEKNQGCMHMTCKKCTHQFCWLCFGDWNNHQDCNKF